MSVQKFSELLMAMEKWVFSINQKMLVQASLPYEWIIASLFIEASMEICFMLALNNKSQFLSIEQNSDFRLNVFVFLISYVIITVLSCFFREISRLVLYILRICVVFCPILLLPSAFLMYFTFLGGQVLLGALSTLLFVWILLIVVLYHTIHLEFTLQMSQALLKTSTSNLLFNRLFQTVAFCIAIPLSDTGTIIIMCLTLFNILDECYKAIYCNLYLVPVLTKFSVVFALLKLNICLVELVNMSSLNGFLDLIVQNRWVIALVGLGFQMVGFLQFHSHRVKNVLLTDIRNITSEWKAEMYLREFLLLRQDGSPESGMYYKGIMQDHRKSCTDVHCSCSKPERRNHKYQPTSLVANIVRTLRSSQSESSVLQFLDIYCQVEATQSYPMASNELDILSRNYWSMSITHRWLMYDLRQRLSKLIIKRFHGRNLELNRIFLFQKLSGVLREKIQSFTTYSLERLRVLSDQIVNMTKVQEICYQQLPLAPEINQVYTQILSICKQNTETLQLMYSFKLNMYLDAADANMLLEESLKMQKVNTLLQDLEMDMDACVVELATTRDQLGTITNCTDQFQKIFGFRKQQIIGFRFHTLIPDIFCKSLEVELNEWFNTGGWDLLTTPRETFGKGKNGMLLNIKIFAKLLANQDQLRLAIWIKKRQIGNYGILEADGRISCLDQKLKLLCNSDSLYFQAICPKMNLILQTLRSQWSIHEMHLIVPPTSHISFFDRTRTANNELESHRPTDIEAYEQAIEKYLQRNNIVYFCRFRMKMVKLKIGTSYVVLQLTKSKQSSIKSLIKQLPLTSSLRKICERYLQKLTLRTLANIFKLSMNEPDDNISFSHLEQFTEIQPNSNFSNHSQQYQMFDSGNFFIPDAYSSAHGSSIFDFTFKTVLKEMKAKFKKCETSKMAKAILAVMVVVCLVLVILLLAEYMIGKGGMDDFMEVIFADAAVSDNMQLLEMFYGKAVQYFQYFGERNGPRFEYILKNAKSLADYLYSLVQYDHDRLNQDITFGTRRYYEYLLYPLPLTLASSHMPSLFSSHFILHYYNAILQLTGDMTRKTISNHSQTAMKVLSDNWPAMKFMNHNNLYAYEVMSWELMDTLTNQLSIIIVIYALISCYKALQLYLLNRRAVREVAESMQLYQYLSNEDLEVYKARYDKHVNMGDEAYGRTLLDQSGYQVYAKRTFVRKADSKNIYKYILMFIVFNSSTLINSGAIITFLDPCRSMIRSINSLMDSENYQLEALFDLKTYYLYDSKNKSASAFTSEFLRQNQQTELPFVNAAISSIPLFSYYDPDYTYEFTDMLVTDICEVVAKVGLADWEMEKCRNGFNTEFMRQGILGAMSQMHRKTVEAALTLQQDPSQAPSLFKSPVYEDIDDSILYMFKIYQLTQARMVVALTKAISDRDDLMKTVTSLEVMFLLGFGLFWIRYHKYLKQVQRRRYGYILLISPDVMSGNKHIKAYVSKQFRFRSY